MTTAVSPLRELSQTIMKESDELRQGGGSAGRERQKKLGRLFVRDRISQLLDPGAELFELGLWAGWKMYETWGCRSCCRRRGGIGKVHGRDFMIVANDASVKAGAFFPMTAKKCLRRATHRDRK